MAKGRFYREIPQGPLLEWESTLLVPIDKATRMMLLQLGKMEGLGLRHTVIRAIREYVTSRSNTQVTGG
jgi:hypothetical protein